LELPEPVELCAARGMEPKTAARAVRAETTKRVDALLELRGIVMESLAFSRWPARASWAGSARRGVSNAPREARRHRFGA